MPFTRSENAISMSKQILLIDDEADIHEIVKAGLMLQSDWTLFTALTGDEGIALAHTEPIDAILLDAMMPQRDGAATLKLLQVDPETASIPVVFLTAKAQTTDKRKFYALGAKGIIAKPFSIMTLASQISGFLGWAD
ncbi:MAG: response regulator [Elainellaceae cyanobacterium]